MIFEFDGGALDPDTHELRHAGRSAPVEPQVFAVLVVLLRERRRMVPKAELLDAVWGSRFVSEATLASRIKSARRAIGDDGRRQRLIRTVHGRGYRFVGEVVERAGPLSGPVSEPVPPPARLRVERALALLLEVRAGGSLLDSLGYVHLLRGAHEAAFTSGR